MLIHRRQFVQAGLATSIASAPLVRALAGVPLRTIVNSIALEDDRVWIAAMIGRSGPHLFIIDTGAPVSLIKEDLAKSLALPSRGTSRLLGIGGLSESPWYIAKEVTLGNGVRFPDMPFAGIRAALGKDAAGTFGAGLFTTYDSDLDFEKGEWRAHLDGKADRTGFRQLKSRFSREEGFGSSIYADATIGSFGGEFLVDTGAPGEISFDSRTTAKSGLWQSGRPYAPVRSRGIGRGTIPARLVRMDRLKIGPFVYERPLLMLREPGNSLSNFKSDGIIGLKALSRLHLSTDVRSGTLWAAPNGLSLPANDYPKSGLWVEPTSKGLKITDVGNGSPARKSGLRTGDIIVGQDFARFLARVSGSPGDKMSFEYERAGKRSSAELTLEDFL